MRATLRVLVHVEHHARADVARGAQAGHRERTHGRGDAVLAVGHRGKVAREHSDKVEPPLSLVLPQHARNVIRVQPPARVGRPGRWPRRAERPRLKRRTERWRSAPQVR